MTDRFDEYIASDDSDNDYDEDDESVLSIDESSESLLEFQERSLRQYFREMSIDTGLRSSPSSAHLAIFDMAIRIMNMPVDLLMEADNREQESF